jgi:hypothetical protein
VKTHEALRPPGARLAASMVVSLLMLAAAGSASAQCRPVGERTREVGCWIVAQTPRGRLSEPTIFWHLDSYPTRAEAEAGKGPRGTAIEALGKVWLSSLEPAGWRPSGGDRSIAGEGGGAVHGAVHGSYL